MYLATFLYLVFRSFAPSDSKHTRATKWDSTGKSSPEGQCQNRPRSSLVLWFPRPRLEFRFKTCFRTLLVRFWHMALSSVRSSVLDSFWLYFSRCGLFFAWTRAGCLNPSMASSKVGWPRAKEFSFFADKKERTVFNRMDSLHGNDDAS